MITTTPQSLGITLPRLGFGCMRLPLLDANDPTSIDKEHLQRMVDYAMANGVNYFDTAYPYHQQHSEAAIGEALSKYPRESFFLVDKMPLWLPNSEEDVDRIFNEQLKRCGVDYFDIYLLHAVDHKKAQKVSSLHIYDYLKRQKEAGRIKKLGFSFHDTPEFFWEFVNTYEFDIAQVQLNYLDWTQQRGEVLYQKIEEKGIPVIVMEPVRGGLLARLPEDIAAPFAEAAPGRSQASFALRWMAQYPKVAVVLSGMSSLEQMKENIETFSQDCTLSPLETEAINEVRRRLAQRFEIPCTSCQYCMDCPAGVDIPGQLGGYNQYNLFCDRELFLTAYDRAVAGGSSAESCISCGACLSKCPQHINIPERLQQIRERVSRMREAE